MDLIMSPPDELCLSYILDKEGRLLSRIEGYSRGTHIAPRRVSYDWDTLPHSDLQVMQLGMSTGRLELSFGNYVKKLDDPDITRFEEEWRGNLRSLGIIGMPYLAIPLKNVAVRKITYCRSR